MVRVFLASLLRPGLGETPGGLADALVALGPDAVPWVSLALRQVAAGWQRSALAGVLERLGRTVPPGDRIVLGRLVGPVFGTVTERAIVQAVEAFRDSPDPEPSP